jgi:translation initiation factor 2 alpha subunit (eIF-2alpha)
VIKEIKNMVKVIKEEEKADVTKKKYCEDNRKKNKAVHTKKKKEALLSTQASDKLENLIKDPATGLIQQIAKTENALESGTAAQASQTKQRAEENRNYQQDVKNLVESISLLGRAKKALDKYYDDLDKKIASGEADLLQGEMSLLQAHSELLQAPETPGTYKGQKSGMNDVTKLFDFIIEESNKELRDTHDKERKAQHDYEDAMGALKKTEADNQKSLSDLQGTLATKEEELLSAQQDLKATNKDIKAIEEFLASIKGGCDFIQNNYDDRKKARETETKALGKVMGLLKGTPAYKTWKMKKSGK